MAQAMVAPPVMVSMPYLLHSSLALQMAAKSSMPQ
jgi:hypothetical protein